MTSTVTNELDKYLQQVAQKCESEYNYFENTDIQATSTKEHLKFAQHQEISHLQPLNQESNISLESFEEDTGNRDQNELNHPEHCLPTIPEEEQQYSDTMTFNEEQEYSDNEHFNTTIDTTTEDSHITMGKPTSTPFVTGLIHIPTEKVGSSQVTYKLQQFLDEYPPKTQEHTFEAIYTILEDLEKYLSQNPQQYTHCMSPDSEYVILVAYSYTLGIDMCNFPNIWAVLSILLDTVDR